MKKINKKILTALENGVEKGVFTRASVAVLSEKSMPVYQSIGELESQQVSESTRFDVASVTKVVPVSTLALLALDKGMVTLDTPVHDIVSDIMLKSDMPVLYRHLLTQTLDFRFSMSGFKHLDAESIWDTIRTAELKSTPGSSFFYCNATSILLGRVVEKLFGNSLDILAQDLIFSKLNMKKSGFRPSEEERLHIVPTEIDPWRNRVVRGEIHDESSWVLNSIMIPGAAGLFSTTKDLGEYVSSLILSEKSLFSEGFIQRCAQNWISDVKGAETGLGFEYNQGYMGEHRGDAVIGKTGFTGSVIVADVKKRLGFVLLSDYTWPRRKANRDGIMSVRKAIADIVWGH